MKFGMHHRRSGPGRAHRGTLSLLGTSLYIVLPVCRWSSSLTRRQTFPGNNGLRKLSVNRSLSWKPANVSCFPSPRQLFSLVRAPLNVRDDGRYGQQLVWCTANSRRIAYCSQLKDHRLTPNSTHDVHRSASSLHTSNKIPPRRLPMGLSTFQSGRQRAGLLTALKSQRSTPQVLASSRPHTTRSRRAAQGHAH